MAELRSAMRRNYAFSQPFGIFTRFHLRWRELERQTKNRPLAEDRFSAAAPCGVRFRRAMVPAREQPIVDRDNAASPQLVKNISAKRAMHPAIKWKGHREILALLPASSYRLTLLAILRKGGTGENEKE